MKWRKLNRWIHRELGYFFFGMAIVYGVSGIALNHHIARHWDPSLIQKSEEVLGIPPSTVDDADRQYVELILEKTGEKDNYKQYYFPSESQMMIYLRQGHIVVNLKTGETQITKIRNRKVFREMNFLHYNKPKQLWTYFADFFGFAMVVLAVTGLFMVRGKKGVSGQGAFLLAAGIAIPLIFLIIYLWT